jgi:hypothetical protein
VKFTRQVVRSIQPLDNSSTLLEYRNWPDVIYKNGQNCFGFATKLLGFLQQPSDIDTSEAAEEWFFELFQKSNIQGGYKVMYFPKFGEVKDFHFAAQMLTGHWIEKRGATGVCEWNDEKLMIAGLEQHGYTNKPFIGYWVCWKEYRIDSGMVIHHEGSK